MNNPMQQFPVPGVRRSKRRMGCMIPMLIIALLVGGAGYFFLYRPVSQLASGFTNLTEFETLNTNIRNTASFTPPASNELSEQQVERYIDVINRIQTDAMARIQHLETLFEDVDIENLNVLNAYQTYLRVYQEVLDIAVEVKAEQVDALNAAGFSLEEYTWVKQQVAGAAGFSIGELNLTNLLSGEVGGQQVARSTNATNQELVSPYADQIGGWAPLFMFGL